MSDLYSQMVDQFEGENYTKVIASAKMLIRGGAEENLLDIFMFKGTAEQRRDLEEDALHTFSEAIAQFPDAYDPRFRKSLLLCEMHRYKEANAELNILNEKFPQNLDVLNSLIFTEERTFNHAGVIALCDHILSFSEPEWSVLSSKGKAYERMGNYEEAILSYESAINLGNLHDIELSLLHMDIGYTYSLQKDFATAKTFLEKALNYDDNPHTLHHLAWVEYNLGNTDTAFELLKTSISLEPDNSYAFKVAAKINLLQHNNEAAISNLQEAKALGYEIEYGQEVNEMLQKLGVE